MSFVVHPPMAGLGEAEGSRASPRAREGFPPLPFSSLLSPASCCSRPLPTGKLRAPGPTRNLVPLCATSGLVPPRPHSPVSALLFAPSSFAFFAALRDTVLPGFTGASGSLCVFWALCVRQDVARVVDPPRVLQPARTAFCFLCRGRRLCLPCKHAALVVALPRVSFSPRGLAVILVSRTPLTPISVLFRKLVVCTRFSPRGRFLRAAFSSLPSPLCAGCSPAPVCPQVFPNIRSRRAGSYPAVLLHFITVFSPS